MYRGAHACNGKTERNGWLVWYFKTISFTRTHFIFIHSVMFLLHIKLSPESWESVILSQGAYSSGSHLARPQKNEENLIYRHATTLISSRCGIQRVRIASKYILNNARSKKGIGYLALTRIISTYILRSLSSEHEMNSKVRKVSKSPFA